MEDYQALAERGLKRVYIGLESGHDPLLEFVRKPGRAPDAIETVQTIKAAGIKVGIIVLIGLGGERFAAGHVADTISVLNQMPLDAGDVLYFSDLVEEPGTPYPISAEQQGIRALIDRNAPPAQHDSQRSVAGQREDVQLRRARICVLTLQHTRGRLLIHTIGFFASLQ